MKYVFVLEDEERFQKEIFESLQKIDSRLNVRFFKNLAAFSDFIQNVIKSGWPVIHQSGSQYSGDNNQLINDPRAEAQLVLLICKDELLGHQRMGLLGKTRDLFIRKGLSTSEDPTSIVITTFERPDFKIRAVEENFITNVIYKPFDPLILQQHLHFAINGRHPLRSSSVHQMKTQVKVEMIKDAMTEVVSDVGFITRSPRLIKPGQVAKYYGDIFNSKKSTFVFAKCFQCLPHPEIPGEYRCWFTFLGTSPENHQDYRRNLALLKLPEISVFKQNDLKKLDSENKIQIVIMDYEDERRAILKQAVQSHFKHVHIFELESFEQLSHLIDPFSSDLNQKYDSWTGDQDLKIRLDLAGQKILKFEPALSDGKRFLGLTQAEWIPVDFQTSISSLSEAVWLKMMVQRKPPASDVLIQLKNSTGQYLVKCTQISVIEDDTLGPQIELTFRKASVDEKKKWHEKSGELSHPIHAILAADLTIPLIEVDSWLALSNSHKQRFGTDWVVSIYSEEPPSEESLRSLPLWIDDYFILHAEKMHWLRKLNLFLKVEFDSNFKFFLSNLEIRVANPIEIQEISETSLIIKYHRAISLGSFRRFVLPTASGGEVRDYLANCNFSEVNPANKDEHLNYFVFFGITDTYLKNIRIWMRDNYVQMKEKTG